MSSKIFCRRTKMLGAVAFLFLFVGIAAASSDEQNPGLSQLPTRSDLSALSLLSPTQDTIRYDGDTALYYDAIPNTWTGVRFTPLYRFELQAIYFGILNQFGNTTDGCSLYVVSDDGTGWPDWPAGKSDSFWVAPPVPDRVWIQVDLSSPLTFLGYQDFHIIYGPAPGGPYPGPGWWNLFDHDGTITQRSYVSHNNRLSWITITDADAFIRAGGAYGGYCPQEPNDLGLCDTIYFETFDRDHEYEAEPGSLDSVRVAIYVTHDSNTFYCESEQGWVQDSIAGFVIPLAFWHGPQGGADSVILPEYDDWNNIAMDPLDPRISRSMFRDLVDEHGGDTFYNRMKWLASQSQGLEWSTVAVDIYNEAPAGSGYCWISMIPSAPTNRRWWEGSRVLLATMTFLVYMSPDHDTVGINLNESWWPPGIPLQFTRQDAIVYAPRHFLPVCDTIYRPPEEPCDTTLETLWGGLWSAYYWPQPPHDEFLNMRFQMPLDHGGRLDEIEMGFHENASSGTPDLDLYVWLSDGIFPLDDDPPNQALGHFHVDYDSVVWYPSLTVAETWKEGIYFDPGEQFHVGFTHPHELGDTLSILSDDGVMGTDRSSGWDGSAWEHYWPFEFKINARICPLVVPLICGDCNRDGVLDVGDVVCLISYLFPAASLRGQLCVVDVNCDGVEDTGDLIYLINYLFLGTSPPCSECCDFGPKREEVRGQRAEKDLQEIRPAPQKLPREQEGLKRTE
jgi:hypothetical protein